MPTKTPKTKSLFDDDLNSLMKLFQLNFKFLKLFQNKNRLEILKLLSSNNFNISEISKKINLSYQNTHAHIKLLEKENIVICVKQEKEQGRSVLVKSNVNNFFKKIHKNIL